MKDGFNLIQDVPNKHRLYSHLIVKVKDINRLAIQKAGFKHIYDSKPRPDLFESKKMKGKEMDVDYFVSLIPVPKYYITH